MERAAGAFDAINCQENLPDWTCKLDVRRNNWYVTVPYEAPKDAVAVQIKIFVGCFAAEHFTCMEIDDLEFVEVEE